MDVQTLSVPRAEAIEQYEQYKKALRSKKDAFIHDLKSVYAAMKHGRSVIDVWQAFADTGLDVNTDPKIAIAPADAKEVVFRKMEANDRDSRWSGQFCAHGQWERHRTTPTALKAGDVFVPGGNWKWKVERNGAVYDTRPPGGSVWEYSVHRQVIRTSVPIVPAKYLPNHALGNYHILWEVEKWDVLTPPKDPFLLKRVSPNIFVVLAGWELTEIERAVLRGRIG